MSGKPTDEEIRKGWERVAEIYEPRPLNPMEKAQVIQAEAAERAAEMKPFCLKERV